jgi:hypothetical protein
LFVVVVVAEFVVVVAVFAVVVAAVVVAGFVGVMPGKAKVEGCVTTSD